MIKNHELRYLYIGRKLSETDSKLMIRVYRVIKNKHRRKYGLEMNFKNIEGGLRLIHPWNITVNDNAVLGENVILFEGCTIGVIETGLKKGNPRIGNNVTICSNSTVCGGINIGDNVWIAAGAFVNFDVPENSVVVGNPGVIHQRKIKSEEEQ